MKFGLTIFPTDYSIAPAELGRAAEDAGFEALFFAEHTHIPTSRETPYSGGGELPKQYWHTLRPVRGARERRRRRRERLRLGTGICLIVERDPITTAKEVASLDHVSGGRFEFGVGAGWNHEEMRNHGTDPRRRFSVMRERVLADEGDLDAGRGRVPRRVRRLRPDLVVAEAGPEAASAGASSAGSARRCSTACSTTATSGCRTVSSRPS